MVQGIAPAQAHANIPKGLWEREMGRDAFAGPATDFYHRNPPTAWCAIDADGPRPHLMDTRLLATPGNSPWNAAELLVNAHVRMRYWKTQGNMDHLVRNADGDELLFLHRGRCEMFCDFGHITLNKGDYFVLPRGTMWRIETSEPVEMLLIESTDAPYRLPEESILGRHLPFDPGVFGVPELDEQFREQRRGVITQVRIRSRGRVTSVTYPFNPLDAEGWKGDLYPIRLNIADIRPISCHRAHVVPSGHTTFISDRFVICTFAPYPSPTDNSALRLPAFHENVDYDEVLFLHDGGKTDLSAGFEPGLLMFDPRGLTHGPPAETLPLFHNSEIPLPNENTLVMLDARDPLALGADAHRCNIPGFEMMPGKSIAFAPDAVKLEASAPAQPAEPAPTPSIPAAADTAAETVSRSQAMPKTITTQSISNELADDLMAGAKAKAAEMGVPMCIAITDPAGNLVQFARMDGAALLSIGLAQDKAYTAVSFGMATHEWHEFIKNDPPLLDGIVHTPRLVVFGGGYPVKVDGVMVGGIGISGGHYTHDMQVAQAALAAAGLAG
jgi:homogentisate 1,2-dioxygenase